MARPAGMICRKSKLKKFSDMKTAGGCGVVPFWSEECLFCQSAALHAFNVLVNNLWQSVTMLIRPLKSVVE